MNKRILLFFFVGVSIYLAESIFNSNDLDSDIYISDRQINNLINSWNAQVGRNPNADELINLINNLIEEEILYREALKLGLEQDDEIIRRRLAQKIIFLKRDAETFTPSDEDLKNFFAQNQSNYVTEDLYTFEHYFFGNDASAREEAEKSLSKLLSGQPSKAGLPFYSGDTFTSHPLQKIEDIFGGEFAEVIDTLDTDQWVGPIQSAFGYHNVKITSIENFKVPSFDAVKNVLLADYLEANSDQAIKEFMDQIKSEYSVAISPNFDL